jgi:malectin (di-glucose binding ER protein)
MPSLAESTRTELERAELQTVLNSRLFARSPTLARLLSYLCEKLFDGESGQIKEYSVALDVFGRGDSFDQDTDSIVRVEVNRLRKRLAEYYAGTGAGHSLQITIPVGQYIPVFEERLIPGTDADGPRPTPPRVEVSPASPQATPAPSSRTGVRWVQAIGLTLLVTLITGLYLTWDRWKPNAVVVPVQQQNAPEPAVGLPVGDEIRILAGSSRNYVDRAGKLWAPDGNFEGGTAVRSTIQRISRTQDPTIYRSSRQGDFTYNVPLKAGTYELHLHFAETFYGFEEVGGGGEGSRIMAVNANGKPLLTGLDVIADAGGSRTADVKVFTDISPAADGQLHLAFSSVRGGRAMLSGIEILPAADRHMRPVRIVTRDVPYYSNDSHWWSPDIYFKGGQVSVSEDEAKNTDDPELYESERWGHFSYAIPVTPGKYTVILHFIEHQFSSRSHTSSPASPAKLTVDSGSRRFNVFCNGKAILQDVNLAEEVGTGAALIRKLTGLEPNAQGKLLLEFVPIENYATVSAIEVIPQ